MKIEFTERIQLLTPNHNNRTCGGSEAFTSTTISKKRHEKTSSTSCEPIRSTPIHGSQNRLCRPIRANTTHQNRATLSHRDQCSTSGNHTHIYYDGQTYVKLAAFPITPLNLTSIREDLLPYQCITENKLLLTPIHMYLKMR